MYSDHDDHSPRSGQLQIAEELRAAACRTLIEYANTQNRKSTVYTIPIEILGLVFRQCDSPEALSKVTKRFRAVALDTPMLWTRIMHHMGREVDVAKTAAYLQRSKGSLLQIELSLVALGYNDDDLPRLLSVLDLLIPHVRRWEEFEVSSDAFSGLAICIARLANTEAPNLRSLWIFYLWSGEEVDAALVPTESVIFGLGAPRLELVKLYSIPPSCCLPPLGSTTKLRIRDLRSATAFTTVFSTLNGLANLTQLTLDKTNCDVWPSTNIIHLPGLTSLALRVFDEEGFVAGFLNALVSPLLRIVVLDNITETDLERLFARATELSRTLVFLLVHSLTIGFDDPSAYYGQGSGLLKNISEQLSTTFPSVTHLELCNVDPKRTSGLRKSALMGFRHLHTLGNSVTAQNTAVSALL